MTVVAPLPRRHPRAGRRRAASVVVTALLAAGVAAPASADTRGVWPIDPPRVVRPFVAPPVPWAAGHRGVDLAGAAGQPVVSAVGGTVTFSGVIAGRGVVVVTHGATRTTYEPLISRVAAGSVVRRGARLGLLDTAGSHCAPAACLHWGWLRGRTYLDPLGLVVVRRVRLLPPDRSRATPPRRSGIRPADAPGGRRFAAVRW